MENNETISAAIEDLERLRIALATSRCDGKRIIDMISPAIDLLRQYRKPEPCDKCHSLYAVRTWRDNEDLGYVDIMVRYCPSCGRPLGGDRT